MTSNKRFAQAQFARTVTIALPKELSREDQIELMRGYVRESFTSQGMIADWVMHDKDDGNPHVHVMLTMRHIGETGWGLKNRVWNTKPVRANWRAAWAQHANVALERAGFNERIDHRSLAAQGIYLEPENYNPHVADHARLMGAEAREELRCQEVRRRNSVFLRENPEHILVVVQSQRAVFTEGDVRLAFQKRVLVQSDSEIDALVAEAMASDHLVQLAQKSPENHTQYVTSARAAQVQRLGCQAQEMSSATLASIDELWQAKEVVAEMSVTTQASNSPTLSVVSEASAVAADAFETVSGPILIDVSGADEEPAEDTKQEDSAPAREAAAGRRQGLSGRRLRSGPSVSDVREALRPHAEDLFRAAFGEPVSAKSGQWRARASSAISMKMRGSSRGLWVDHRSGEGGDLLDLVATVYCGLDAAKSDFPRVMEETVRYVGLSISRDDDGRMLEKIRARSAEAEAAAQAEEREEARRKAALVRDLVKRAQPVADSLAESYLRARGISEWPEESLAWLPPVADMGRDVVNAVHSPRHGALVVWARDETGAITGGQRILLNDDGTAVKTDVRKPSFGMISGAPARFAARFEAGEEPTPLIVAEGPESALTAWLSTGYETWAVFGVSGFRDAPIPSGRPVIFAPDRDAPDSPAGKAFRKAVAQHMSASADGDVDAAAGSSAGLDLRIALAPEPSGSKHDLNDTLQRAGVEAVAGAVADARPVQALLSAELTGDQRAAARAMLSDTPLTLIKGHAGTGKTFTLAEVTRVWQARGYEVLGGAPSGKATSELAGIEGMRTASLAAWEARWSRGETLPKNRFVFVMDEAGMVGAGQWARLADRVQAMGGKLIAVGDPEQLQPISDLPGWDAVERAVMSQGGSLAVMSQVRRQRDAGDRAATQALARGGKEIAPAIRHYIKKGAVRLEADVIGDPIEEVAAAYYDAGGDRQGPGGDTASRIALAYTNSDVWALNDAIRKQAIKRGIVDAARVRGYGDIERIDRSGEEHHRIKVPLALGPGDRIMLTRPHRDLDLPRSTFGSVVATRDHEIDVVVDGTDPMAAGDPPESAGTDSSKPVTIDLNTFRHIDYGYAATIHKSQGLTVDHALVVGHSRMHRHAVYVALSRHRESVTVFGRESHLSRPADLIRLAQVPGHLSVDMEDAPDAPSGSMVAGAEVLGLRNRGDWLGSGLDPQATRIGGASDGVTFAGDSHLMAVAERVSGLLGADYVAGDPILKEDPGTGAVLDHNGYAQDPTKVIDALLERRSVIRADDVASELSGVVAEPETFLRLFREAMAHPDLVVLSQKGHGGEGRVYTTGTHLQQELAAVDLGTRLALADVPADAPHMNAHEAITAEDRADLTAEQAAALEHGLCAGRLQLIRGDAGTGKTRVAARLADIHARHGWQVVGVTPSGAGLDALREAGLPDARTLRQFIGERRDGRLRFGPGTVVVLDDAGRLGGREAGHLLEDIEASGAKLVALLDGGIQTPLEAGPVMRAIEMRVGSARMEAMQGRSDRRAEALRLVAAGDAAGIRMLRDEGVVHSGGNSQEAAAALAERYVADAGTDRIALAWSRSEADMLTAAIRKRLDAVDPERGLFEVETSGSFADLRPGDRLRFMGRVEGAEGARTAVFAGRDADGQMLLRFESRDAGTGRAADSDSDAGTGRDGVREVAFAADRRLPEWHFAFADTIHSSMGQAHGSVHLLASTGMNRQVLVAGLNLHLDHLSVTVPVDEERVESTLTSVLRRDASAVSVLDYGFDPSLGAREAQRVPLREPELQPASIGSQALDALSPQAAFAPVETPVAIETQTGPLDAANRHYLLTNPDHVLVLLQSEHPVFTEGDIREALRSRLENADTGMDASTARDIEEAFARVMASGHLVELNQPAADGKLQYVTRARAQELQKLDRCVGDMADSKLAVVDAGWRGIDTGKRSAAVPQASTATPCPEGRQSRPGTAGEPAGGKPGGDRLSEDQLAASEAMLSDTRLTLVKGHAGTGKTFALNEVARAWQARGYAVLGGALSARATQGLDGIEGMRTGTLAAWEARWSRGDLPKADRFVFVMDEAGMVGTGQWSRIAARVAAMGGKLIAVGDPEQLQPVGDVPGWVVAERALERSGQTLPVMGEVRRQRDAGDRAATQALARGGSGIEDAIHHYADTGSLRFTRGVLADPVGAIADAYYTVGMEVDHGDGPTGSRVALAYTNREVRELNGAIRARALERGVVDRSAVRSYGMIERLDVSGGEQQRIAVPLELGPGDRIMLMRPHRDLDLPRSSFGTVLATREHEIDLAVDGRSKR